MTRGKKPAPLPPVAEIEAIRSRFPALQRRHEGWPVAYFDGPGGTQVPRSVVEAMSDYLFHHNANTHWEYPTSEETDDCVMEAREILAEFVNGRREEVVFGQNMTTLTFHLARGLGREWGPGDEVVITDLDHHANRAPWTALATERGVTIRSVPFDPETGVLSMEALESALSSRTRLLAIGAASNALGTVPDAQAACALARSVGALSFVDGVHSAPHVLPDVARLDCDFFVCSPYKFYGPHLGVLWGRRALLENVDIPRVDPAPNESPERIETGTLNHEGLVGAGVAVRFLADLAPGRRTLRGALEDAYRVLHERSSALFHRLWDELGSIPRVKRFGPPADASRTATAAFTIEGHTAEKATRRLAEQAVFVSHGDFYAATVIERLELPADGLLRAGCACYTTEDEVDRLLEGVASLSRS